MRSNTFLMTVFYAWMCMSRVFVVYWSFIGRSGVGGA